MRPRHLIAFVRATLLTGATVAALAAPAFAQPSQDALDGIFVELKQLQDANLGIARQMSDIQRRAAAVLEAAQAEAAPGGAAQQEVVTALISNALTLASVMLAPVATQDVAAGEIFSALLEQNLTLVARSEPLFRQSPRLAEAMEQYAVMQVQTQDLGLALSHGWSRYGEALTTAEAAGLLPAGAFDPKAQSWALTVPDVDIAGAASLPPDIASNEERLTPQSSALDAEIFAAEPDAEVAAALQREAERLATVAPENDRVAVPGLDEQTKAESADADAAGTAPIWPASTNVTAKAQPAAWMVMIGDNARAVAMALNSNAATAGRIRSMQIGCHPNGTLRYVFEADGDIPEYLVFANQTDSAKIRADANVVSGGEAIHMSDVLRLAFEGASANGAPDGHLMIAAGDAPGDVATFPASGYLEARGRVLDGCVPWVDESRSPIDAPATGAAEVDGGMVPEPDQEQPSTAADPGAPIPRPRPASRMPVDLMNAG